VLVLTRRAGESIVIGDEVRVVVLEVRGDTVRLGIEAPRSVQVHRAEVYAEVQAANAAAASGTDLDVAAARLQRLARPRPPRQRGSARLERLPAGGVTPAGATPAGATPEGSGGPDGPIASAADPAPASGTAGPRALPGPPKPVPPRR
jgi:carbon storage regulator